ncbi:hypothetical protein [uncultured Salinisphaera sp.]|uniref:hypothetical protein n=1 Tax=uncultured Salinisphaera sp. TaxID=359372 RepID=UPI0032B0F8A9|tara:strand:- start:858 stop:1664 length:807 start_codon:yes stop_codon:yes gene_type:complete
MRNLVLQKNIAIACGLALTSAFAALPAFAADSDTQNLRGEITAVSKNSFKLDAKDGTTHQIKLTGDTGIATAMPGNLKNIKKGTFIGTANVERDGDNTALEMVIFPPSMKGMGLGDYGWDLSPSMVNKNVKTAADGKADAKGSATAGSSMTNGTVSAKSEGSMSAGSSMTNGTVESKSSGSMTAGSSMTNGTVTQSSSKSETMTLKVDYGDGTKTIVVPKDVPTVKLAPGKVSDLKTGAHAFAIVSSNGDGYTAKKVIVGKNGTVPPM